MEFIRVSFKEALDEGEVPVGCLIVFDGKEIGRGRNNANEDKNATKDSVQFFFEKWLSNEN